MELLLTNLLTVFQNGLIVLWYWMNTYIWELALFICLAIIVVFEVKEASVHFVNDNRKVI